VDAQNWLKKNTRKDMIMWQGQSTGIFQENAGSVDRSDKWYNHVPEIIWENENYKLLWDSLYTQTITSRLRDQIKFSLTKARNIVK